MKIYMAGPLFSSAELAFNAALVGELRGREHEVFLPQEHEQRKDLPAAIFEGDVRGPDWAGVVVGGRAGPDPDPAACWERASPSAKGRPQVVYRTDFRLFEGTD